MNAFVKTNGSVNAREIRKPKKNQSRVFFKQKVFFLQKNRSTRTAVPRRGSLRRGAPVGGVGGGAAGLGGGGSGGRGCGAPALPAARGEANGGRRRWLDAAAAGGSSGDGGGENGGGGAIYRWGG